MFYSVIDCSLLWVLCGGKQVCEKLLSRKHKLMIWLHFADTASHSSVEVGSW